MLNDLIKKGMLLGVISGMMTILFDSLYMLIPDIYVPKEYPFFMVLFNIFYWALFGAVSGCVLWIFARTGMRFPKKEHICWVIFFLVPFLCTFVYFGLADTAVPSLFEYVPFFTPSFSFLWPLLVLVFLIIYFARTDPPAHFSPFTFTPEILVILLLVHFSANTAQITMVSLPYYAAEKFFNALGIYRPGYMVIAYFFGIAALYGLYLYSFFRFGRFHKAAKARLSNSPGPVVRLGVLFAALAGFVALIYTTTGPTRIVARGGADHRSVPTATPVILIVLDTVRADHLSLYGYPAAHNNLEAFAKDALVFDTCIANAPWTLPSHASLFTGLHPNEHGAHGTLQAGNIKIGDFTLGLVPRPLDDDFVTLAEIFQKNGYRTMAMIANNTALERHINLHQGFDIYECFGNIGYIARKFPFRPINHFFSYLAYFPDLFMDTMRAEQITDRCMQATGASEGEPFFLFINFMDAHEAYCPPRPYNGYYANKRSPHLYRLEMEARQKILGRRDQKGWSAFAVSQYDGAIAYLDDQLGRFFEQLKQSGTYDRALIIVTSDHGELFGEHGFWAHTTPMYEGVVRVPLIIKFPYSKEVGRDTKRKVQLHDLFSTTLSICGLPVPENVTGKPFGNPDSPPVGEWENSQMRHHRVLYDGQYKYFYYERERPAELYDLQADPLENNNLSGESPDIMQMLDAKLKEWVQAHPPRYKSKDVKISPETIRGLKALGYLQ